MDTTFIAFLVLAIVALIVVFKTAVVVPQQNAFVVERLGKYSKTLNAGFHILWPFVDKVAYKHTLKEQAVDIAEQICITKDNVQVGVDGVLYLQVLDPRRASYGIGNYMFAISQLAQTTLRSEIGKIAKPRKVWIVKDMPKTRSGKIMRRVLAAISNNKDEGDVTTLANPEIVEEIKKMVQG